MQHLSPVTWQLLVPLQPDTSMALCHPSRRFLGIRIVHDLCNDTVRRSSVGLDGATWAPGEAPCEL